MLQGSLLALSLRVLGTLAAIGVQILAARYLGQTGYGEFAFGLAVIGVLVLLARVGFQTSLVRFVGQYTARQDPAAQAGVLIFALSLALAAGLLMAVGGLQAVTWLTPWLTGGQAAVLQAALWLLPPLAVLGLLQAALRGFRRIGPSVFSEQLLQPVLLAAALLVFFAVWSREAVAPQAIRANLLAVAVNLAVMAVVFALATRRLVSWRRPRFEAAVWLKVSLPLMLMSGLLVLFNQTDIIMLGMLGSAEETGVYAAAARVARLVLFGLTAVNAAAAPMIAEAYHAGRQDELRRTFRFAAAALAVFTAGVVLFLVVAGKWVLGFFGPGFAVGWGPLLVLLIGQAFNSLSGPVASLLSMTGRQGVAARIVTVCVAVNIVLNLVLIPSWGMWGAAVATSVSVTAWNAGMLLAARRELGLNPSAFRRWSS
jgi:O-antigen/teichoic acid export membrane protein